MILWQKAFTAKKWAHRLSVQTMWFDSNASYFSQKIAWKVFDHLFPLTTVRQNCPFIVTVRNVHCRNLAEFDHWQLVHVWGIPCGAQSLQCGDQWFSQLLWYSKLPVAFCIHIIYDVDDHGAIFLDREYLPPPWYQAFNVNFRGAVASL